MAAFSTSPPGGSGGASASTPLLSGRLLTPALVQKVLRGCKAVSYIVPTAPGKRGTGFLIGPTLLLTCHHVLPTVEVASKSRVFFFQKDAFKGMWLRPVEVGLDPSACFFTSENHTKREGTTVKVLEADKDNLDFTIVALKADELLADIQDTAFNIFNAVDPIKDASVWVLQCPEVFNPQTQSSGDLRMAWGTIRHIASLIFKHNAETHFGSSGGPVVNEQGELIGLHHQRLARMDLSNAILPSAILKFLDRLTPEQWENLNRCRAALPLAENATKVINQLPVVAHFTAREPELSALSDICLQGGQRVAVTGIGGIGKSALIGQYVRQRQTGYSLVYFVHGGSEEDIDADLLAFSDVVGIAPGPPQYRLSSLRAFLETTAQKILVVFDGIDDERSLAHVSKQLPQSGVCTVILSSRLQSFPPGFQTVPLRSFSSEEAAAFLIEAVEGKDADMAQAILLAARLYCFPLALKHAAGFIASTEGYTFRTYLEELGEGLSLLGEEYVLHLGDEEKTIFTTWKKSTDAIVKAPQGDRARDILRVFSQLADFPIPKELLEELIFVQKRDRETAIRLLKNYSLLEESNGCYLLHPLERIAIRRELGQESQGYIVQAVKALYDCLSNMNPENPAELSYLSRYVSHIEAVIQPPTSPMESNEALWNKSLLALLWRFYFRMGKYESSKRVAELQLKMEAGGTLERAKSLHNLGESLEKLFQYQGACHCYEEALQIKLQLLGKRSPTTVNSYSMAARCLARLSNYKQCISYLEEVFTITSEVFSVIPSEDDSGRISFMHFGEAPVPLETLSDFVDFAEQHHSEDPEIRTFYRQFISAALVLRGLPYVTKMLEQIRATLGEDDVSLSEIYPEVADFLMKTEGPAKALEYARLGLQIRRRLLGEQHLDTAVSYQQVGVVLSRLGKFEEADKLLTHGLEMREQLLGERHPDTARSRCSLGENLARLAGSRPGFMDVTRLIKAEELVKKALEAHLEMLGKRNPETGATYRALGLVHATCGNGDAMLENMREALEIDQQVFGEESPNTATSLHDVGEALRQQKKPAEALSYFQRALERREALVGAKHPVVALTHEIMGICQDSLQEYDKSANSHSKALEIRQEAFGEKDLSVSDSFFYLGIAMSKLGICDKAIGHLRSALAIRTEVAGENSMPVAQCCQAIGEVLKRQGKDDEAKEYFERAFLAARAARNKAIMQSCPVS